MCCVISCELIVEVLKYHVNYIFFPSFRYKHSGSIAGRNFFLIPSCYKTCVCLYLKDFKKRVKVRYFRRIQNNFLNNLKNYSEEVREDQNVNKTFPTIDFPEITNLHLYLKVCKSFSGA